MARSLSSQKRLRQSKVREIRNRMKKSQVKTAIRRVTDAVHDKKVENAEQALRFACKLLDRSGHSILHPNMVARKKSQLTRMVAGLKSA
ncbi:MAG: 30S ribosomal protein S20 [Phycisphaerales bacterium]|nr:30S ribosomal protein S20 [Phycisphaerales bacterium]MCB9857085.1 30S ribosomal protein S20 [Phycisphaerales bacterium]MCB9861788.1 30S ribosomal protein S20 [Phycisphaerales bacterium]